MIDLPKFFKPSAPGQTPVWFNIAVAFSMMLSAGASLVAALRTSVTMSALVEQNARLVKAGSTPILQFNTGISETDTSKKFSFTVENVGTGPARVVWFELSLDGRPVKNGAQLTGRQNGKVQMDDIAPQVLPVGRPQTAFGWEQLPEDKQFSKEVWREMVGKVRKVKAEACYCSVFEACWISNMDGKPAREIDQCNAEGHVIFGLEASGEAAVPASASAAKP